MDGLLSANTPTITAIVTRIFQEVYGNDIKKVQVVLPDVRKESTCYGGLYRKKDVEVPTEFNFQGVSNREYENVEALVNDFPVLRQSLLKSLNNFNTLYKDLLRILISNSELENFTQMDDVMEVVSSDIEDSLNKNFKTQVKEPLHESEVYHDSVFFLPIIDNILKLTQL